MATKSDVSELLTFFVWLDFTVNLRAQLLTSALVKDFD